MRKGGSVNRSTRKIAPRDRVLVVVEGEVTELQYLQGLVQHLRASGVEVASTAVKSGRGEPSL